MKQLMIMHKSGFESPDERQYYTGIIHSNILLNVKVLIQGAASRGFQMENVELARSVVGSLDGGSGDMFLTPQLGEDIAMLWADPAVQKTYWESAHNIDLENRDSCRYFFDNVERVSGENYIPSVEDILRARSKTTGISEVVFETKTAGNFRVVDVGGQRNERKKWIHCFQEVTAIIFFVNLAEYDLRLQEDIGVNRMKESMQLYDDVFNCHWFLRLPVILFLNKSDIFAEKIQRVPLSSIFTNFDGGADYDKGVSFIKTLFLSLRKDTSKPAYCHVTNATDTEQMRNVFASVKDSILNQRLDMYGHL
eukprot:TRINITY_DN1688_c0_g1_i1.p1 TRINITY_DN1688_c0_g1~~TRINITY_DN1688_c0_g1_i1.p1  ORF type:complete len:308 (-),score=77.65 TRINITY_DN1688_c0_g1_i1:389-1312(-)